MRDRSRKSTRAASPAPGVSAPKSPDVPAPKPETTAPARGPKPDRLSVQLTSDGLPDVDAMHPKTRERLATAFFQNPDVARKFGKAPVEKPAPAEPLPRELLLMVTGIVSELRVLIHKKASGAPEHIVQSVIPWSDEQQEMIADPLGQVLQKYLPANLNDYGPEIQLGGAILFIEISKIKQLRQAIAQHARRGPVVVPATAEFLRPDRTAAPAPAAAPDDGPGNDPTIGNNGDDLTLQTVSGS